MPAPHLTSPQLVACPPEGDEAFLRATMHGFHRDWDGDALEPAVRLLDTGRSFGHQVEGGWVSTCSSYARRLVVPGGTVSTAAVTWVTVSPSYRRRGLLTELMAHQLATVPEPVALLWASEAGIYGRYGYGAAVPSLRVSGPTRETAFRADVDLGGGSVEEVGSEEFRSVVVPLHARLLADRPGSLDRTAAWWDAALDDRPSRRPGQSAQRYALHHDETGAVDGYLAFRLPAAADFGPGLTVRVTALDAVTPAAHARLWRFVLDLDLVRTVEAAVAGDDPLPHLLADPLALTSTVSESTHVRLLDVPAALEARRYATDVDVVVAVTDPRGPEYGGTYRLAGGPDGASVGRVESSPDVHLGVRELGAAYLGGTPLTTLGRAGLVQERTPGALGALARALAGPRLPFCRDYF
ncbi:GNAT family N-acetyltransferase [Microlunatus capsulatus]|uniref:Acetyltransferase n=1 Tax=Microlunatus capsulatus TaxID=99117 RepID=A0ABS4Z8D8_9ACTN|nr:GNAT family N-acetyltransferase [Microlunatus capsulatus]MBP2417318.1 putative acetyltransferase [Microlunatus capsulatus]